MLGSRVIIRDNKGEKNMNKTGTMKQKGIDYYLAQKDKMDTLCEEVNNWHGGMTRPMSYDEALKWLKQEQALGLGNRQEYKRLGGVYEFIHSSGWVAYVGESGRIYSRLVDHRSAFDLGRPYISPNGKSSRSIPCQYKMRAVDPNRDNWLIKIRLIKTDCVNFRRSMEKNYEDRDQPRFNDEKMNKRAA